MCFLVFPFSQSLTWPFSTESLQTPCSSGNRASPSVGSICCSMSFSSVDFPAPLGPGCNQQSAGVGLVRAGGRCQAEALEPGIQKNKRPFRAFENGVFVKVLQISVISIHTQIHCLGNCVILQPSCFRPQVNNANSPHPDHSAAYQRNA